MPAAVADAARAAGLFPGSRLWCLTVSRARGFGGSRAEAARTGAAATVAGAEPPVGHAAEAVQNHTPAIKAAETTRATIKPNALRMFTLSTHTQML